MLTCMNRTHSEREHVGTDPGNMREPLKQQYELPGDTSPRLDVRARTHVLLKDTSGIAAVSSAGARDTLCGRLWKFMEVPLLTFPQ